MRTPALIVALLALALQAPGAMPGAGQPQARIERVDLAARQPAAPSCQWLAPERFLVMAAVLKQDEAPRLLDEEGRPSPADF